MQRCHKIFPIRFAVMLMMAGVLFWVFPASGGAEIQKQTLADGVVKWYRPSPDKPMFFKVVEEIFKILPLNRESLPFGRSIAFLVGVSDYEHISPDLPFVKNDLTALRKYLLERGGFDEVYVAAEKVVSASLVSEYMMTRFKESLTNRDRLLFYYSGHGTDIDTGTGYMQFSEAKPGRYNYRHYLEIEDCKKWSRRLPVKHALFIFDCCASGLAFTPKSDGFENREALMKTLSGNGSRTVITAGTADQESFGVKNHSVFTRAFLNTLESGVKKDGFMTITEVLAGVERDVSRFCQMENKKMKPKRWDLQEHRYTGAFLFIDEKAENLKMSPDVQKTLNARPVKKSGGLVKGYGEIEVVSFVKGGLYFDGKFVRDVETGDGVEFPPVTVGEHSLEVRSSGKVYSEQVNVVKGGKRWVTFRRQKKEDETPPAKKATSTLRVESEIAGAVITINGQEYDKAPQDFTIDTAGEYVITVAKSGYEPFKERKYLKLGERYVVKARFKKYTPPSATVTFPERTPPSATVTSPSSNSTSASTKSFKNKLGMEFVYIPPGEFMMGSPKDEPGRNDDEKRHKVKLTKGFYMQTTEVTQWQWREVMGDYPSYFNKCGGDCPVEQVSWDDVQKFINKLNSRKEGTYRLPTEAEWEYACRAETTTPFWIGKCLDVSQANYDGNYPLKECSKGPDRRETTPVATFPPNPWGLYDMHGNVWEWCQDWYEKYPDGLVKDPVGPKNGSRRVQRGGSWSIGARNCRSAYRGNSSPDDRGNVIGFRVAAVSRAQ